MSSIEIVSEAPMNAYELRDEITKIKKRDGELNFRASKTEDYLNSLLSLKDAGKLVEELKGLEIPRLRDMHIHKLVELAPETTNDVKVVLQGYSMTISAENCKKIADTIAGAPRA